MPPSHSWSQSGPFIVTTKRQPDFLAGEYPDNAIVVSRRAVPTLEEAKAEAAAIVEASSGDVERQFYATAMLRADEVTTLPLPDGTMIEVEPAKWSRLCTDVGRGGSSHDPAIWQPEIIAAWNEANDDGR